GPGSGRARLHSAKESEADDRPVVHRGVLVPNIVERLGLCVVGVLEPGDLGAKLRLARAAFEDLDLRFAHSVRLVPIAGRINRGRLGTAGSKDSSGYKSHRSERMIPHKNLRSASGRWRLPAPWRIPLPCPL